MAAFTYGVLMYLPSILSPYVSPCGKEQAASLTQPLSAMAPGVYLKLPGRYLQVEAEGLTWRTGSLGQNGKVATLHLTGRAHGGSSRLEVSTPAEFLIVLPEQVAHAPFTLLKPDMKEDRRDFAVALSWRGAGYQGWSGKKNATIGLEAKELSPGTFSVGVPALPKGEYGFLLPTFLGKAGMPAEKVYTFRTPLTSQAPSRPPATADAGTTQQNSGVKVQTSDREVEIEPEVFEWFPLSYADTLKAHVDTVTKRTRGLLNLGLGAGNPGGGYERFFKSERMNGTLGPGQGGPVLAAGAALTLFCAEGTDSADYRLVAVENNSGERKLRVDAVFVNLDLNSVAYDNYLGFGKLSASPGPEPIPFQAEKVADRQYKIIVPKLKPGQYGLLAPGTAALGRTGSVYAFEIR